MKAFSKGWHLLAACALTVGVMTLVSRTDGQNPGGEPHKHHHPVAEGEFSRTQPSTGGPIGSENDRGRLVAGFRDPKLPAVPVIVPDVPDLPFKMVDGFKEFHLTAEPVKRELLPDQVMNHWGYNGSFPGPTIQVMQGDKVRIVVHNNLPEDTTLHLHGLELVNSMDGVPNITQAPIAPGKMGVYEVTLHQSGTFFYHSHDAMQELMGMVGLFIIHPKVAPAPAVDYDFALIMQEFRINPAVNTPDPNNMDFNWFTLNGRSAPYTTPLPVKLGSRVRIRFINFSTDSHHPMHLHGHTFWVTGTEGGRIPPSAWIPGNTVLVGVSQVREVEFIANNQGDWVLHCHMFHHMMNHMIAGVGPGSRKMANGKFLDPRYKVPGYPQMEGSMRHFSKEEMAKLNRNKETSGLRDMWEMHLGGLHTIVRVLPPNLYDELMDGKSLKPGINVPGMDPVKGSHMHKH